MRGPLMRKCAATLAIGAAGLVVSATPALAVGKAKLPDLGPNVTIFDPSMPVADINAKLQSLATACGLTWSSGRRLPAPRPSAPPARR